MRLVVCILLLCSTAIAIPKKQIQLRTKYNQPINAQEIKLSDVDLALYQTDVQQDGQRNHLKSEITNWAAAKSTLIEQLSAFYNYFEIFLSKQQQIGIFLVCFICFAFYLMVKSEDRNIKNRKQNPKRMPQKYQEPNVVILTDSIIGKEQSPQPLVSTIIGSIIYEERVNKSADDLKNKEQPHPLQRSNSQPFIKPYHPDYSAEEINDLLKDIN
ncbi:unnamed protein product [Paramecium pentaurelia]|uniref:Uncharacterized protein n=1 Tax=Paramecium pentaurelia TaxID=43138 RepID=A0A8S1T5Q8_9CILI|nr:unnamed protein product [Paramecium pentaurelia]